jgi:threonine dehydrogenase-like Zn-dependent dehydrogenase
VDHLALRRDFALRGGAHHTLQPADDVAGLVRRLTGGRGADAVVEVSGTAAGLNEAIRTAGFNPTSRIRGAKNYFRYVSR